jgi:YegS/Rv2252/BmrU family lipid kinase
MEPPIILIANPTAKRSSPRKIERAVELLRSAGREVEVRLTEKRGDAEDYARTASGQGASLIIAAGGDGTFNEVINGIAKTEVGMAILPMGTTNVLAKELGIPEEVEAGVKVALTGKAYSVSLGIITLTHHPSPVTRYFCLMAGIGFDGEAVYSANPSLKKYSGKGAYILSGLKTLLRYSPEELTFTVDGKRCTGYSAVIGKASKYGGNFRITPHAKLTNPELYAFIMHGKKRADLLRYALGIMTGKHLGFGDVTYSRADSVRVEGNARVQIDGDYIGSTPADIGVVPDALRLIF